jgi:hypothetical protein
MNLTSEAHTLAVLKASSDPLSVAEITTLRRIPQFLVAESLANLKQSGRVREIRDAGFLQYVPIENVQPRPKDNPKAAKPKISRLTP